MSASRPASATPVAIFETARGISRNECPTGGTHRVRRAPPGARRHLRSRPADLPCGSRPPNPFPAMSAPPGALIANGGRHWVPAPPGPSDALASLTQP